MPKKKKAQLKPVARGFSTTSVPKKKAPKQASTKDVTASTDPEVNTKEGCTVLPPPGVAGNNSHDSLLSSEDTLLQSFVDSLQDKAEKEIVRTVKAIKTDRRFTSTLPRLTIDSATVDRVINLASGYNIGDVRPAVFEPEEKGLTRLAITYGVLRRLGVSEEKADICLWTISGIDVDEAYEWLCANSSETELEAAYYGDNGESKAPRTQIPRTPQTPRTPSEFLATPTPPTPTQPNQSSFSLNVHAPSFSPSAILALSPHEDLGAALKSRILQLSANLNEGGPTYITRDNQSDAPWNDTKETHHENTKYDRTEEATATYHVQNHKFADPPETPQDKDSSAAPQRSYQSLTKGDVDIFDEDDNEDTGFGVLGLLDTLPFTMTDDHGKTVVVRDMPLPKHWSGRTPTSLLSSLVAKTDKYAVVSYNLISGPSRAKRSSVCIRWNGQKTNEWKMEDVACHDSDQAEQYIATVALHALTFPPTEGFPAGASNGDNSQSVVRSLPTVFRDLWDEMEATRKARDDAINRSIWAKLRSMFASKLEASGKLHTKVNKAVHEPKETSVLRLSAKIDEGFSEQLMLSFQARQANSAYQEMLIQRNSLPIAMFRDHIIQSLQYSQILVLSGETGCGKSTQVPAFILEHQLSQGQPCKIFCTEPRRISAISLAQRVSRELGDPPGAVGTLSSLVGYSIRLESNTSRNTRLTFVTNGIALRMLENGTGQGGHGTAFDDITHIVIDEVHERTIESDFLLIVLKSLLEQRSDLKVILMSATVDADKVADFFGGCPTLHIPGRTFPVEVNYLEDAVELTGWNISEGSPYARRMTDKFHQGKSRVEWFEDAHVVDDDDSDEQAENIKLEKRYSVETTRTINLLDERLMPYDLIIRLLEKICLEDTNYLSYSSAILIFMPGLGEIRRLNDLLLEHPSFSQSSKFRIYPLHSTLSNENQTAVFDIPPQGVRKFVIATNIAETGITIPDITCVVDSGKHREMRFDEKRQISRLVETFIAKSNAAQRRGRAGRVQQGLCFHLFTKFRHDIKMVEHPLPEMMRLSLSDLSLRIKIMDVKLGTSIESVLSRAIDPPPAIKVQRAVSVLVEVGALTNNEDITPMGRLLSKLPTDVHLAKFLLIATLFRCLDPALTIAAALNSKSPFVSPFGLEQEADRAKNSFRVEDSDFLTIHNAFSSWRRVSSNNGPEFIRKFCRTNFLSHQNLQQIEELRQQFLGYLIDSSFIQVDRLFIRELTRIRYSRNRTRFVAVPSGLDDNSANTALVNAALVAGLYPKVLSIDKGARQMRTITNNKVTFFHPSSVNFGTKLLDFGVNYLAYFTLMQSKKLYAWETSPADDLAILLLCGECEHKFTSNSISIDRKIRFHVPPKVNIALKMLRTQLASLLASQYRGKVLTESQIIWNDLALSILGKMSVDKNLNQTSIMIMS